ncbi:hypothetical protein HPB47_003262 [Ixodes persulcatus]|uniref:Uncharacterized protein n=1 Tax=Ixodes persulcatus TaxID=34615 RepID=A0AC60QZ94_IXOPE|nr:hypothetical protein HPB47_003262 [Ixodes persulcatus]
MLTLKVVVVGSCACGKTTLIRTFLRNDVRDTVPSPTVQEVYTGHIQHHRTEADVVLLCFSVRDIFSPSEVPSRWAKEIRHFNPLVPVLLVATQIV